MGLAQSFLPICVRVGPAFWRAWVGEEFQQCLCAGEMEYSFRGRALQRGAQNTAGGIVPHPQQIRLIGIETLLWPLHGSCSTSPQHRYDKRGKLLPAEAASEKSPPTEFTRRAWRKRGGWRKMARHLRMVALGEHPHES